MIFDGAIIKEQGLTFGIAIVKLSALSQTSQQKDSLINEFSNIFGGIPTVLMAQDNRGIPKYYGRTDIVNFLAKVHPTRIPWKRYTLN